MYIILGIILQNRGLFVCKLSVSLFPCKLFSMCGSVEVCFVNAMKYKSSMIPCILNY